MTTKTNQTTLGMSKSGKKISYSLKLGQTDSTFLATTGNIEDPETKKLI